MSTIRFIDVGTTVPGRSFLGRAESPLVGDPRTQAPRPMAVFD